LRTGGCHVYTVYVKARTTAERIVAAATRVLEREGAEQVTMRRVARAVGVSAMAIYRHFPNREALLRRVVDETFAKLSARWSPPAGDRDFETRLMEMSDHYLDFALEHPHAFDYMYSSRRDDARRFPEDFRARCSPTANLLADLVEEGMSSGFLRRDDVWDVTMALWAHGHGLICLYRGARFSYSAKQFRDFYRASLLRTLRGLQHTISPKKD
jgi:AcrR family transcriptional regulator